MTALIDESAVAELVTMEDALEAVSKAFLARGRGRIVNLPRQRLHHREGVVRITAAVTEDAGYFGVKVSSSAVFGSNAGRIMSLYELSTGRLCAVIQVFGLGALRTGAVSGVATDLLARPDSEVLGLIGTGRQARTQLAAIKRVRPIRRVRVFGRDSGRRGDFADSVRDSGLEVTECESAREAVECADIVVTATAATDPVLLGDWLSPGVHVNAIGANHESKRELDSQVVAKAGVVATDEPSQAQYEASDLIHPVAEGLLSWEDVHGIHEIITGFAEGRRSVEEITLFKSLGTAVGDVLLAAWTYERALERGYGVTLPELSGGVS